MNKKLGKLLRASRGAYFLIMAGFCAAALFAGQFWLAAGESAVPLLVLMIHKYTQDQRDRQMVK